MKRTSLAAILALAACHKAPTPQQQMDVGKDYAHMNAAERANYDRAVDQAMRHTIEHLRKAGFTEAELERVGDKHGDGMALLCVTSTEGKYPVGPIENMPSFRKQWQECDAPFLEREREQHEILEMQRKYGR
jgi:hypothetical protein